MLALLLAAAIPLATTEAEQRVALPVGAAVELRVDALGSAIELRAPGAEERVLAALRAAELDLCPQVALEGKTLVLRCRTPRLDARIVRAGQTTYLDVRGLRGLPWRAGDDAVPTFFYDPEALGFEGTAAADGERALALGHTAPAAARFKESLTTEEAPMASLRLGDLALAVDDLDGALGWYRRAGTAGPYGRMASERICELTSCTDPNDFGSLLDAGGLPEPLRTELELRAARVYAFLGQQRTAAQMMADRLRDDERPPACGRAQTLCRRLAIAALRAGPEIALDAMSFFLALPERQHGALAPELAAAAAEVAADLGAPDFGANLLAATAGGVDPEHRDDHLARAAELYLAAGDRVRAGVVEAYARLHRHAKKKPSQRWAAVGRALDGTEPASAAVSAIRADAALDLDVAAAITAAARARAAALEAP